MKLLLFFLFISTVSPYFAAGQAATTKKDDRTGGDDDNLRGGHTSYGGRRPANPAVVPELQEQEMTPTAWRQLAPKTKSTTCTGQKHPVIYVTRWENTASGFAEILSNETNTGEGTLFQTPVRSSSGNPEAGALAVVCDNTYYYWWPQVTPGNQLSTWYSYNTKNGRDLLYRHNSLYSYLTLGCAGKGRGGPVLAAELIFTANEKAYVLQRVSFKKNGDVSREEVGRFSVVPTAFDLVYAFFVFDYENDQVWGLFPNQGILQILSTENGAIQRTFTFDDSDGYPQAYAVFPHTKNGDVFKGVVDVSDDDPNRLLSHCMPKPLKAVVTFEADAFEGTFRVKTVHLSSVTHFNSRIPMTFLGDFGYLLSPFDSSRIVEFNQTTGYNATSYQLRVGNPVGLAVTCG